MFRILWTAVLCSGAAWAQYTAERTAAPPGEVAPGIAALVNDEGFRIRNGDEPYCEIWFRRPAEHSADQPGAASADNKPGVTLPQVPVGALEGVIHFDQDAEDRRGQTVRAGFYTLRYAVMPSNDEHLGAAPHRDFLLLVPMADDPDPKARPNAEALVTISRRVSGSEHPAILSVWKSPSESDGFSRQGDDWVLDTSADGQRIALIVAGTADR